MAQARLCAFGVGSLLLLGSTALAQVHRGAAPDADVARVSRQVFHRAHPGAMFMERADRITRIYGRPFSAGVTAAESAEAFRANHAAVFGVQPQDLAPAGPLGEGRHVQGIMYQSATKTYKFTGFHYRQERNGVPVFRAQLKLLVRNEPGFPLVLASADLRNLGGFAVDADAAGREIAPASVGSAIQRAAELAVVDGEPRVVSGRRVIFAGTGADLTAPRLADETLVAIDIDRWLIVTDAATGEVLFQEQRIYMVDIDGTVAGNATEGIGAEHCEDEVATPLPYLQVTAGANSAFSDVDGNFVIPNGGVDDILVMAGLDGQWFDVFNAQGAGTTESELVTPPGPANLLFNTANTDEAVRAQVNAYVGANISRDFVLQYNPSYPTLDLGDFPVNVNRTDGPCPGNAFYISDDGGSINFCLSSGELPNTAFSSVIYHEYGHHLVEAAGSGQGAYGEGMSDVVALLINDSPLMSLGFHGNCGVPLRNADNSCQYDPDSCSSCGSAIHACGNLLSGCVWSTRDNLVVTEPVDYLSILSNIAVNAILLHTGSSITSSITVDYLTLDDDDADLLNGTPHYHEINNGFSDHGLPGPPVEWLGFSFPNGLPDVITSGSATTVAVEVTGMNATPQPGTGKLFLDAGSGYTEIPMTEVTPNVYDAVFPALDCGTSANFYFSAETTEDVVTNNPLLAPNESYTLVSASLVVAFGDDFETDQGWTVTSEGFLSDGAWERAVPLPLTTCDRGNPGTDADGSGQCYVTDNSAALQCNSDVDGGTTILTSPAMDASGDKVVTYWRWLNNSAGINPGQDPMVVEVSDDNGASWVELETVAPNGAEASGGWFLKAFVVADFVNPTDQFRIRFKVTDFNPPSTVEAGADGVRLLECAEVSPCPWDLTGDGFVKIEDFLELLGAWGPNPGHPADFDEDGAVAIEDFLALLGNWGPCP